ncbi:MAG TPA: ATP-binding protein [Rhizomicrobium sp.]|nr:ATP-binding protein [Rhizomicrobium sp.]
MKPSFTTSQHRDLLRRLQCDGLLAVVVFAASCLGLTLIVRQGVPAVWMSNALIVCFVLWRPADETRRTIVVGIAARLMAGLLVRNELATTLALSFRDLVEVLIITVSLRALGTYQDFTQRRTLLWFYAIAGVVAPLVAALISAVYLFYYRGSDFLHVVVDVYVAHALGMMVIVPMLFTVRGKVLLRMFLPDQLPTTLLLIGIMTATIAANALTGYPLRFLFFPALLFLTFKRSFEGGAIGMFLLACYFISPFFTGHSVYGLGQLSLRGQILAGELFEAVVALTVVLTGTVLEERRRLEQNLMAATSRAENAREEAMLAREEAIVAKDAAEDANHMKSMFLATMSHELRTPLNAVIGFSQVLVSETFGPLGHTRYREYVGLIEKAGQHLLSLINDILDMSKIEAGKAELHRETIDCNAIVEECVRFVGGRARENEIALTKDLPAGAVRLNADPRAIKQILLNLLSNAIKFTPPGGHVTVRLREQGRDVKFAVEDSGVGIPADQISRLGNPFVQLRGSAGSAQEGTGLGLALVRALAQLHGGALTIESSQGHGTTATVSIPTDPRKPQAAEERPPAICGLNS